MFDFLYLFFVLFSYIYMYKGDFHIKKKILSFLLFKINKSVWFSMFIFCIYVFLEIKYVRCAMFFFLMLDWIYELKDVFDITLLIHFFIIQ